jgi:CBS domain-containing membrane protein
MYGRSKLSSSLVLLLNNNTLIWNKTNFLRIRLLTTTTSTTDITTTPTKPLLQQQQQPISIQPKYTSLDILKSSIGAGIGIGTISVASLFGGDAVLLVAGMGSSAILLFAAPHLPFSQPRNVIIGHVSSATIGAIVNIYCPQTMSVLAPPIAVALALGFMQWSRTVHPPAGGTALGTSLGMGFSSPDLLPIAFFPIPCLTNTVLLVGVAMIINPLMGRKYPVQW